MKLVSVITPLYNSERFICEALQSVLDQTHTNVELLVIDDGSPDDSANVVEAMGDPRIQVFRQDNTGPCRARNSGIARAKGDFIAFIDHDDHWAPDKLEKHIAHLERNPLVGVSYGPSAFIDENGGRLGLYQVPQLTDVTPGLILCRNPIGNGSAPLIRREVFEAVKFMVEHDGKQEPMYFDDECRGWEDVECWFRISVKTDWEFEGIADCLTYYRVNSEGLSADAEKKQRSFEQGLERARTYAPDIVARYEGAARAYHLRYLARRLVTSRDGRGAVSFAHRALRSHPRLLVEEPKRTLITLGAAYALLSLPRPIYERLESAAIAEVGRAQAARVQE
jgi:glycosyltransferase involved in cell wall biosynthesis